MKSNNICSITTPSYCFSESIIKRNLLFLETFQEKKFVEIIYALKALSFIDIQQEFHKYLAGFSASSLFEAIFARDLNGGNGKIHFTSPGIHQDEIRELAKLCDYISFNSLNQWRRLRLNAYGKTSLGLRVNPKISFVKDRRYDPSCKHSKLGVPLENLIDVLDREPEVLTGLEGIHFHTNSESTDFSQLLEIVLHLDQTTSPLLRQVNWINLGGGYYFDECMDFGPFDESVDLLKSKYSLDIILEPGIAVVQEAGSLISEVIDLFDSDGMTIAVLDTTVNHLPEVLEFQYQPEVKASSKDGRFEYILAGSSCLAGDNFGAYRFNTPLKIGSRVEFTGVGAYSMVKAHMFNGINLPSVYLEKDGEVELLKQYNYKDFLNRCGAVESECLRKRA